MFFFQFRSTVGTCCLTTLHHCFLTKCSHHIIR